MLKFRNRRMTNYLERNQQCKLLGLMAAVVLVLLLVSLAADPNRWAWLSSFDARQQPAPFRPDTRLAKADQGPAADGSFRVLSEGIDEANPAAFLRGLRTDYLQPVRDDTVFRDAESDGWFHMLELLMKVDANTLAAAAVGKLSFRQLYQQPKFYRGKIVSLSGVVRRARRTPAPKNSLEIDHYFELLLEPQGEPNQLIVIYTLELPNEFPRGNQVEAQVQLTGFFFKRWAYAAQDAVRTAPLVLAKTVVWRQRPAEAAPRNHVSLPRAAAMALGLFLLAAVGFLIIKSLRRNPRSHELVGAPFSAAKLAELEATLAEDASAAESKPGTSVEEP